MKRITFTIDGHSFSTDFSSSFSQDPNTDFSTAEENIEEIIEEREKCIKEILEVTGKHYGWYKEITGNKNWILYDTEQYEVRNFDDIEHIVFGRDLMDAETFLCVRKDFKGKLHLPINASTCSFMFVDINIPEIDLTEFDTTNVVNMDYMFLKANLGDCFNLGSSTNAQADSLVSSINAQATNTESTFTKADLGDRLKVNSSTNTQANDAYQNILTFNTEGVTSMSGMFKDCKVKYLDLSSLRTRNVIDFSDMFCNCNDLIDLNVDGFDTSQAEDLCGMFHGCHKLTQLNVKYFNVNSVLNMSYLFSGCRSLKVIDLEGWNFSQVKNANEMFGYCEKLEKIIANFNFKIVRGMATMFDECFCLSEVDLTHSDLSHVFDFGCMFFNCEGLKEIRFSQGIWQKAEYTLSMFGNCKALERLNLPDVVLDDVIRSYAMFDDCDSLKEIYMEHPFNLDKYEHELIFGNCKAEVKKSTEWQ